MQFAQKNTITGSPYSMAKCIGWDTLLGKIMITYYDLMWWVPVHKHFWDAIRQVEQITVSFCNIFYPETVLYM